MWLGVTTMKETDWGWFMNDKLFFPNTTDLPPAPKEILKMIKCGCNGSCDNNKCTCRKNGMVCTTSCKNCKGVSCCNVKHAFEDDEDEAL